MWRGLAVRRFHGQTAGQTAHETAALCDEHRVIFLVTSCVPLDDGSGFKFMIFALFHFLAAEPSATIVLSYCFHQCCSVCCSCIQNLGDHGSRGNLQQRYSFLFGG